MAAKRTLSVDALTRAKEPVITAISSAMSDAGITKSELARRMRTSRSLVNRLLDPATDTSLPTLVAAAAAVGKQLRLDLVEPARRRSP
ncbi:MAG TPA: Fis family transcriptional regulator [Planctomycetota bacterium]|nr:Fis family transcriptional regulator [Planctomycetota bacterium]